jgi:four helix bundle protein
MSLQYKEDLKQLCFQFSREIVLFVENIRKSPLLKPLGDQLIRAGTSIGANVVEAKSASTRKDFTHYYEIALKSAHETKYWLELIGASANSHKVSADGLIVKLDKIIRILTSCIMSLKNKRF